MTFLKRNISLISKSYQNTKQCIKANPAVILPFAMFAILELFALFLLFLAPRMPLRLIFGPPIRTLWGEGFLHYPSNFLLLPKLASWSRMFIMVFFGSFLTGTAVLMVLGIHNKKRIKLSLTFKDALSHYISLFAIVLLTTLIFYVALKIVTIGLAKYFIAGHKRLLFWRAGFWLGPMLLGINFVLAVFIQSIFIYAIPFLLIEKEKLINAIIKSAVFFKKFFLPTFILVGLPTILYIPIVILQHNSLMVINKLFPEFILLICIIGAILSALLIDLIVTVSTTALFLINREK